jgi:hypothetical protein
MLSALEALAQRLGISRSDCILNAIQLHASILNVEREGERKPVNGKLVG